MTPQSPLPAEWFQRRDETRDDEFYISPRKVVHIDEGAIAALKRTFAVLIPPGGVILDLMSSWRSHLPAEIQPARVVGLGMNDDEMRDNPALAKFVVHNLNEEPRLPFEDAVFDQAVCTVSVQYLTRPAQVFAEVQRVLKPGGRFIVSFSNRCFPTKAVSVWLALNDAQHLTLVAQYFNEAGGWTDITGLQAPTAGRGDPLFVVHARKA